MFTALKSALLPDRIKKCPILFGPLRGARPLMKPRSSLRYILGLYEHELNGWLKSAIPMVTGLFDVGANQGVFCFGVMAAWHRMKMRGQVWAFEPEATEVGHLHEAKAWHDWKGISLRIEECFVGRQASDKTVVIDEYLVSKQIPFESISAMIKIDVEGAELDVLRGARKLIRPGNLFLVEIHSAELLVEALDFFAQHQHPVDVVCQKALPFLGKELRSEENWWLVSRI